MTKLAQLFSKTISADTLSICLQANTLSYCHLSAPTNSASTADSALNGNANIADMPLISGDINKTLHKLVEQDDIQGQCHLVLHTGQYHLVQINKPEVPDAELASALKWQIKDLVPITPENMVLDYFQGPSINNNEQKLNVVCAGKKELQAMVAELNKEPVRLTSITIPEFAFANLLPVSNDAVLMVCQQPDEEIFILVVRQAKILFYRHLRGFAQIANKSETELDFGIIDSLSLEIQKSADYFERQLKQAAISSIKVIIPCANEDYLATKLAGNTNVALTLLELPEGFEQKRQFAAVIGATLSQRVAS